MVPKILNKNEAVYDWVLIAKGIGIILVVVGHFYPNTSPEYWRYLNQIIYKFHMPLFFILSGFLFRYEKYQYMLLIKKKINRLLIPFVIIATLFFVIKYFSGIFFNLENPVEMKSVYALLFDPRSSFAPGLWFVYTLFLIFLIFPLFRKVFTSNLVILCLFLLFNILFGNNFPVIGSVLINMPYFVIGVIFHEKRELRAMLISGKPIICGVLIILFILLLLFFEIFQMNGQFYILRKIILGVSGAVCAMNISSLIDSMPLSGWLRNILLRLGFYSMTIYLFHPLFLSSVRIMFYQVLPDIQVRFELIMFCSVSAGIVFSMILEKFVLRKFWFTRRYILGLT